MSVDFTGEIHTAMDFSALINMPALEQQPGSLTRLEKAQVGMLVKVCQPGVVVETGVWRGCTTRFMAEFLSLNQIQGMVYAFDLPEVLDELRNTDPWFSSAKNVTLMPGSLPESLAAWLASQDRPIDFALVDAYHGFRAMYQELSIIAPRLSAGGYIFCHDYGRVDSKYEAVMCAVNEAAKKFDLAVLPLWTEEDASPERFCQAAILHRRVHCPETRRLFHWRKYLAQKYPGLSSLWGRVRHRLLGD